MKKIGLLGALTVVVVPVAILMAASSRYPTMIERRIEQTKKSRQVPAPAPSDSVTIEVISPDGKVRPELEQAVRSTNVD